MLESEIVGELEVQARLQCHAGGFGVRGADLLVLADEVDSLVVPDGKSLKAYSLSQDVGQDPGVDVAGEAFDFVEGGHYGGRLGALDNVTEGVDLGVEQLSASVQVWRPVAPPLGCRVACEMLERGRDVTGSDRTVRGALETLDHGGAQAAYQKGVLTEGFVDPPPA